MVYSVSFCFLNQLFRHTIHRVIHTFCREHPSRKDHKSSSLDTFHPTLHFLEDRYWNESARHFLGERKHFDEISMGTILYPPFRCCEFDWVWLKRKEGPFKIRRSV
jgi:hypothetical protein